VNPQCVSCGKELSKAVGTGRLLYTAQADCERMCALQTYILDVGKVHGEM